MALNIFDYGVDTDFPDTLNANFALSGNHLIASEVTSSSTSSSSYVNLSSIEIGAEEVSNHVWVIVEGKANLNQSVASAQGLYVELEVESDQKYERLVAARGANGYTGNATQTAHTFMFYYEPSSGEKSSGFTIDVNAKSTAAHSSFTLYSVYVIGA